MSDPEQNWLATCKKGVDIARMRPAEDRCHARDLSALIDLVRHGREEVGIRGKHRVKVLHHAVLPDEGMRPVEASVQGASYHLAPVVDAGGYGGMISRQSAEVCYQTVLPKYGNEGFAVSATTLPNHLCPVAYAVGDIGTRDSEARKREGSAVFPQHGVMRSDAVSRVAYDLALLVDALRLPVWIANHCRKSLGFAVFPYHRRISLGRRGSWA